MTTRIGFAHNAFAKSNPRGNENLGEFLPEHRPAAQLRCKFPGKQAAASLHKAMPYSPLAH